MSVVFDRHHLDYALYEVEHSRDSGVVEGCFLGVGVMALGRIFVFRFSLRLACVASDIEEGEVHVAEYLK